MTSPLISVIIATHNREELLPQAVQSILDQTLQDFEIIIVDDCSSDNTPNVIRALEEKDDRIRAIRSNENIGPGAARNLGMASARGDYIAIMDDDDLSESERFEKEVSVFNDDPDLALVFSSVAWVDDNLKITNISPGLVVNGNFPADPEEVFRLLYLESNKIPNTTIMIRKPLWSKFKYPEFTWIGEDWYFFMQLAASSMKMRAIPSPLVRVRRGSEHEGLMKRSRESVFKAQRQILDRIKKWLSEEEINNFNHLHRLALSNQILRESRHHIGVKGLGMVFQAFLQTPTNPKVLQEVHWYLSKAREKTITVFRHS